MLIRGNTDTTAFLVSLSKAREDDDCVDLDLQEINFDHEETSAFVDTVRSKTWKSVKISSSHGEINDVCTGAMTSNVESFHVQSNVNLQTISAISFGIKYSKSLLHLSLSIDIDNSSANLICKSLARNTSLQTLKLCGSNIHGTAIGQIGFALRINRTLKNLSLDSCYLEDDEISNILMALQDHPSLRTLSLQQNSCHTQGMQAIACLLHYNDLEELDLSYLVRKKKTTTTQTDTTTTQEGNDGTVEDNVEDKNQGENEKKEEEKVDDGSTGDVNDDEEADDEASKGESDNAEQEDEDDSEEEGRVKNKSLKVLRLAGNGLNDEYIESLFGIFGASSSLSELNLFGNRINDSGLQTIIRKIPQLKSLKSLWLGHNSFSPSAAIDLVDAVKNNFILEEVNIRSMHSDSNWDKIQSDLDYYARLNRSGRRLISADKTSAPLSLWPIVLERANRIYWGATASNGGGNQSHAADSIYCLLHGPALLPV